MDSHIHINFVVIAGHTVTLSGTIDGREVAEVNVMFSGAVSGGTMTDSNGNFTCTTNNAAFGLVKTGQLAFENELATQSEPKVAKRINWLGTLELFSFLLPHKTRERVFTPAYEELKEDHLKTCRLRTPWTRRWLTFCFAFRTGIMVLDCFRALLTDRAVRILLALIPGPIRLWWYS